MAAVVGRGAGIQCAIVGIVAQCVADGEVAIGDRVTVIYRAAHTVIAVGVIHLNTAARNRVTNIVGTGNAIAALTIEWNVLTPKRQAAVVIGACNTICTNAVIGVVNAIVRVTAVIGCAWDSIIT